LINDLICPASAPTRRDRQAESLGGLEVDDQLKRARLLYGQVGKLGAVEDAVEANSGTL
jgi:hypothetical protein